ncbi:MAG: hypothetical protein AAFX76_09410 [Planctomycetota bacterium]
MLGVSASALTPAELVTPELERRSITLASLGSGELRYFDDQRRLTREPTAGYVRLELLTDPDAASAAQDTSSDEPGLMAITLVDGQDIVGRWADGTRGGEAIVWEHPELGRFTFGLDDVRSVTAVGLDAASFTPAANNDNAALGDTVTLANGDRLTGFIVAVGGTTLTIAPDGAAGEVTLEVADLAGLTLANPPRDAGVEGDLVALADGTRVRATGVTVRGNELTLTPVLADAGRAVTIDRTQLRRVDFAAGGLRLVALGDQPMRTIDGGEAFGLTWPPERDAAGLRLHAPVTVEFDLPEGVRRFAATAELDPPAGVPAERAALADIDLWVGGEADGGVDSTRPDLHLDAGQPAGRVNLELDPGSASLRLRLDPAANGPVLDRLRLRQAVLLLDAPPSRPGTGDLDR